MSIKRAKTKMTDIEMVPVFEYYAKGNQTEGEKKMVGAQLLQFVRQMGTTHIVARNMMFPEGHPHWSQFVIVDVKKLEEEIEGRIDLSKLVAREQDRIREQKALDAKKNPKKADFESQIKEEIRKGISDAHQESTDGNE